MMRSIVLFFLSVFCSVALASNELFDENLNSQIMKIKKKSRTDCEHIFNMGAKADCELEIERKMRSEVAMRGTEEYLHAKYSKLSKDQSKKELVVLKGLYSEAEKKSLYASDAKPGELSIELLGTEITYLRDHLKKLINQRKPTLLDEAKKLGMPKLIKHTTDLTN